MITVKDITNKIEELAPLSLSADFDNTGLLVGREDKEVKKVLVTLDVDEKVCLEAVKEGADLIISHHPVMFHAMKRLTENTPMERLLRCLISNDISLYSAHTNLDCAKGGINDFMAEKLGIFDSTVIEEVYSEKGISEGFGRKGVLKEEKTLKDIITLYKKEFDVDVVRYVGDENRTIKTVAVNTGGGAFALESLIGTDTDLFISGDFKYNQLRDAYENNLCIIDAFHYDSEKISMEFFYDYLKKNFDSLDVIKSNENVSVIKYC